MRNNKTNDRKNQSQNFNKSNSASAQKRNSSSTARRNRGRNRKEDLNEKDSTSYSNDPAWYASDPTLARDSASIPFSWATGTTSDLHFEQVDSDPPAAVTMFTAPGALIEWLRPSVGEANAPTSPINVAASGIYSYVRHANSGHANYDVSDLTLYLIAVGEIIAYTNFLIRAYGTASLVSSRNRYLPKMLLEAQHIDAYDICANLAQFRYDINLAMNKLSSFAVPANFTYYKRKAFLFSGIYTEGTSAKDQLYLYAPAGFYEIDYDSDYATALSFNPYHEVGADNVLYSARELTARLNSMIDALVMSEDLNIMSGDILKAYGEGGILKYGRVEPEFTIGLTFDIGVLEQIKNATILPEFAHTATGLKAVIHQGSTKSFIISEDNVCYFDSTTTGTTTAKELAEMAVCDRILTTTTADVSPELVLESTRLMVPSKANGLSQGTYSYTAMSGTEIAIDATILQADYSTDTESDYELIPFRSFMWLDRTGTSSTVTTAILDEATGKVLQALPAFKFSPAVFIVTGKYETYGGGGLSRWNITRIWKLVSFDNYAVLTRDTLWRMHEACLLNMTRVPAIGSIYSA